MSSRGNYSAILVAVAVGLMVVTASTIGYWSIAVSAQVNRIERSINEIEDRISQDGLSDQGQGPVKFVLETSSSETGFVWIGIGGEIDGMVNPDLVVQKGQEVTVEITNRDGVGHTIEAFPFAGGSELVTIDGDTASITFIADQAGRFQYFCNIPGHREAGMQGALVVEGENDEIVVADAVGGVPQVFQLEPAKQTTVSDISRRADDLPPPITRNFPTTVRILLETKEVVGELADGATYDAWTFNGTVPGPFLRVREGDTVEVSIMNSMTSAHAHSIDLHAVIGPGGGAVLTQVPQGETQTFSFLALKPGFYVYHCASPHIPTHIANGMYGAILVEPAEGLPPVDKEFYVLQSEFYTNAKADQQGHHLYDIEKAQEENPSFVVFNGRVGALTGDGALVAEVGDTVRIYFANIGPNLISSFHVIGAIFDRVYQEGSIVSDPIENVQTTLVPAGGVTVVEWEVLVPGNFILVDHSIFRALDKGAVGILTVSGDDNPAIFGPG